MDLLQSNTFSHELYADVPVHQLLDIDITKLSPKELNAYIEKLDTVKHAPATRKAVARKESRAISKGTAHETIDKTLAHLL